MRGCVRGVALVLPALLAPCACGDGGAQVDVATTAVDTLADGTVRVVNSGSGLWAATGNEPWELVEDLRIGRVEGDPRYVFGSIRAVLPGSRNRIWVLDSQASELRLFGPDGTFQLAVGGRGQGPGEFAGGYPCAWAGLEDDVWVEDQGGRWHHFDAEGGLVSTQRSTSGFRCGIRTWLPDGRLFVVDGGYDRELDRVTGFLVVHRLGPEDRLLPGDTVFQAPETPPPPSVTWVSDRATSVAPLPFAPLARWALGPDGDFRVYQGGTPYALRRQTTEGGIVRDMEREYEPVPVPDAIRDEAIRSFRREGWTAEGGFDPDVVPRVYPPIDVFFVGADGTVWIRRYVAGGRLGLDVFSPEGTYLGEVRVPDDFDRMTIRWVGEDLVYVVARDELDVPYAVRLRIRRPTG